MALLNGRLPAAMLKRSVIGVRLTAAAANSANRLAPKFAKAIGHELLASDGYRALNGGQFTQEGIFLDRYRPQATGSGPYGDVRRYKGVRYVRVKGAAAAVPGTSNHGLGLAADFASGINASFTSAAHLWMVANAGPYGWSNTEGRSIGEPWHWVYSAKADVMKGRKLAIIGRMNKTAYKRWQAQLGVKADGIFGPGSISRLQRVLNGKDGKGGFSLKSGPLAEDGVAGPRTWKAVQKLINVWAKRGVISLTRPLKVDGKPGSRTIKALRKSINANRWE